MATSDELLSGMSAIDRTLIIDNNFRTIHIPDSVPALGVEYDDDVHKLKFRMPRFVTGTDLSEFAIRINYINSKGESDVYTIKDENRTVDSQYITFTWLVGPTATRYKGNTKFNVCCKILSATEKDESGNFVVEREFNTTIATLPVLEGLEVDDGVVSQYSDLISQWQNDLFGATDSEITKIQEASTEQQNNIIKKGEDVLDTIPDDYQTIVNKADETARTKADAIVCSVDDELVCVEDSSDDVIRGLSIFGKSSQTTTIGKNLCDEANYTWVKRMIIKTSGNLNNSDSATFVCTENYIDVVALRGQYISLNHPPSGDDESTTSTNASLAFYKEENGTKTFISTSHTTANDRTKRTHLVPTDATHMRFTIPNTYADLTADPITVSGIQIELGEESTDYEPYTGGVPSPNPIYPQEIVGVENPTVKVYSKNLLKLVASNSEVSGVKVTVRSDGSVTFKGTAAAAAFFGLNYDIRTLIPGMRYRLSGCPAGGSGSTYRLYAQTNDGGTFYGDTGNGVSFTATDEQWQVLFVVYKDYSVNFTIYPELRLESIQNNTFVKYDDQIVPLTQQLFAIPVASDGNYVDSNGQHWIADEVDLTRGVLINRTALIDLTQLTDWGSWGVNYKSQTHTGFYVYYKDHNLGGEKGNVICTIAPHVGDLWGGTGFGAWTTRSGNQYIAISIPTSYLADASSKEAAIESFKTLINEKQAKILTTIVPVEIPLSADELAACKDMYSNYPVTMVTNDRDLTMRLTYNADTKMWIENYVKSAIEQITNPA